MQTILQDLRYGARTLARNKAFTAVAVLTLALGIGANTAIFSVVNAVLLQSVPYKDPGKLVYVWTTMISQGVPISGSAAPDFREWREHNHVFEDMAAYTYDNYNLALSGEQPLRVQGAAVSPGIFSLLGVNPLSGRTFLPAEEQWGRNHSVLVSYSFWQTHFGGQPTVLGRNLRLGNDEYAIIGVMPKGMPFFDDLPRVELWVPLSYAPKDDMNTRGNHYLNVVARLKPGASVERAGIEMAGIAKQIEQQFPENKGMGAKVVTVREQLVGDERPALLILLGAVAFVLLIACANIANLMLARATARQQEFAVRAAMGAGRGRLLVQLLLESLPIAAFGGAAGIMLASWGIKFLESLIPADLPRFNPIAINTTVLVFSAAISLLTTLFLALAPALFASKGDIQETLREGGRSGLEHRGSGKLRSLLVVSEVAMAVLLLAGAGLLIKTFGALRHADPGFSADHLLTMQMQLSPETDFPNGHEDAAIQFYRDLSARVDALPGVKGSGITTTLPLGFGMGWGKAIDVQGHTPPTSLDNVPDVRFQLSTPGFLPSIAARLRDGRFFTWQDNQTAPGVAIINEAAAHQFFPNENPIGKMIWMRPPLALVPPEFRKPETLPPWRTIIGVIADMKDQAITRPAFPTVYAPYAQYHNEGWGETIFAVRTTGDPLAATGMVRDQVHSLLPNQPIYEVASMEQLLARSLSRARFSMLLLSIFAALALVLSAVGIYGVMAYAVAQRTREIGVRLALGAQPRDVLGMVLVGGGKLAAFGLALGLIGSLGVTYFLRSQLYGVSSSDPITYASVALLLGLVALAACYLPARRATRVDPLVALRYE
ncbi:MAG: macrolide transporter ATP-binding/permease protein [Candidatus Acidoferrum typicum]|nr:macrolide transporter ATP-binding/permease protein [Candidatus Acidoferrum typicum]